ncbi:MAG TPA: LysR substrate-binding domain-containing protein [Chitinophagaceae bacterium]|nr:LysR substrate-binding domain-containing protein [Chitinophagaceae bacterium]
MIIDFRLQVFQKVAQYLSFTKAAEQLYISQPSVTKHINELEKQVQKPLFSRKGRKISLTAEGEMLLGYANRIISLYRELNEEVNEWQQVQSGDLKIGASTTIAQYILPAILAKFREVYADINLHLLNGNTKQIETHVLDQKVDVGVIEGKATNKLLHYQPFIRDEIVLVTRQNNNKLKRDFIQREAIKELPLLLREKGSGTLAVLLQELHRNNIFEKQLKVEMELGSSESLKTYLFHSNAFAFVSIHTVLDELSTHRLKVIDIEGLDIARTFQFVTLHGEHSKLHSLFKNFCLLHHNF